MKKIFIYAYTSLNLGDDLFIKLLCERYPKVTFYITSFKYASPGLKKIDNLKIVPKVPIVDNFLIKFKINKSINDIIQKNISSFCDGIVNIGGSIFIQQNNWYLKAKNFENRVVRNKPYYIIGSNFGPFTDNKFVFRYRDIFEKVEDICFRDDFSYNLFSDLPNVRWASDVVFAMANQRNIETINNYDYRRKYIILSLIDLSRRNELKKFKDSYINKIAGLANEFVKKNYDVYLMGFCEGEGDKVAINSIMDKLTPKKRMHIIPYIYSGDLYEALDLIRGSQGLLGSRFHAMILGWIYKKPVYPIIYSDKSLNVIKDINFKGMFSRIENVEDIEIDAVVKYIMESSPIDITKQVESADLQFKMLDRFLNI